MASNIEGVAVALVVDINFDNVACLALIARMPVWMVDSPNNHKIFDTVWATRSSERSPLTKFGQNGKSSGEWAARIVCSLDDHHCEWSQKPAYNTLHVIGAKLDETPLGPFLECGFDAFFVESTGFTARKNFTTSPGV